MHSSSRPVRVAIVGDFDRGKHSHWATEAALFHAAAALDLRVAPRWVSTTSVHDGDGLQLLAACAGVWGAPGSPFRSAHGMLRAIAHAREHDLPYLGTCAGFQYALIELTRNVLGIADADSAENTPHGANVVIRPVLCEAPSTNLPRLSGANVARVLPQTRLSQLSGAIDLRAQYFCSYEVNGAFLPRWQQAGLRVAAVGGDGELRAFELADRRFFIATLFQPQLSSSFEEPHPIITGFLRECAQRHGELR